MKPYASYKPSGVAWLGDVPTPWAVERLRFRVRLNPSFSKPLSTDLPVSFLPMEAIGDDGALDLERTRPVGEVASGYTYFEDGDVAIAKITPCYENGKGAVLTGLAEGVGFGTTELIVMRPTQNDCPQWLYYLTMCSAFRLPGEAFMQGAGGQKRVPDLFVKDYFAPIPPPDEQQAIADYLDTETERIDTLVQEKEELIGLLREAKLSTVSSILLGGLVGEIKKPSNTKWLGDVPASWVVCRVKHAVMRIEQGWSPECENRLCAPGEWGVLKAGACNHGRFNQAEHKFLPATLNPIPEYEFFAGDVLMSRASGSADLVGSVAFVDEVQPHLMLSDKLFRLVPEEHVDGRYLAWALNTDAQRRQILNCVRGAEGLARNITTTDIKQLWIALPTLDEQKQLAVEANKVASGFDALITHTQEEIALLKELRAATIADAVLGRVDVRSLTQKQ